MRTANEISPLGRCPKDRGVPFPAEERPYGKVIFALPSPIYSESKSLFISCFPASLHIWIILSFMCKGCKHIMSGIHGIIALQIFDTLHRPHHIAHA